MTKFELEDNILYVRRHGGDPRHCDGMAGSD